MVKKIICVIILSMIFLISLNIEYNKTYAASTVDGVVDGANDFVKAGSDDIPINETNLKSTSDFIFTLLLAIAIVGAVIIGMIIGIQFMMAGIEEKAKIKETLLPYFVGCVVVFGAFAIWELAINILSKW